MSKTIEKYASIAGKVGKLLYGGDYNPDQWLAYPEVLKEDLRLMKLANCNCVSLGIFAWSALEPEEGVYTFKWLDKVMDDLADNGIFVILATPSGARPAWMAAKYPEILRVNADRKRILYGRRHNHCYTSPIYREKTQKINRLLADRYKNHQALLLWHVSNEYGGECHCELCQEAFRNWLKKKYGNDLEQLNHAWWTGFWSHRFTDWLQIESPAPHGEMCVHAHNLDWKRFVTDQTIDFYNNEVVPLRELTPDISVTTNFMGNYPRMGSFTGLDYWKFKEHMDIVSWDCYPAWHNDIEDTWDLASNVSFVHDIYRTIKEGQPFLLLESTPSLVNWHKINKQKRPGMNLLSSIQAIAHGSDSVLYFQWRKGRGGSEKLHGAVVDHCGHEYTRVFKEAADAGAALTGLAKIAGTTVCSEVAIVYDWENRWAIDDLQGLNKDRKNYEETCQAHYKVFWQKGIPVDIINMDCDFSKYKLLVAPMLYMVRPGVAVRIENFVKAGGTFVTTYWSGIVDENDLCFLGGFPGPLRGVLGIWSEEIDTLYDTDVNEIGFKELNDLGLQGSYTAKELCDVIHTEAAKVLASYKKDYYAGMPAVTVNSFGKGKAYYVASRNEGRFNFDFYSKLIESLGIKRVLDAELPLGVTAQQRTDGVKNYIFIMNFSEEEKKVALGEGVFEDMFSKEKVTENISLGKYGFKILAKSMGI